MPIAKVYLPDNVLTPEQRRAIVQGVHDVINSVERRPTGSPTYVQIHEVPARNWGFSGRVYESGGKS